MKLSAKAPIRLASFALAMLAAPMTCVFGQNPGPTGPSSSSQPVETSGKQQERFWIAGRYDGNRVIVYFDAVKFNGTKPSIAEELPPPVANGFFTPKKLPWSYVAKLQQGPDAEHFKIGDQYDLIFGSGLIRTITLTTLVGAETDEGVGNDSFIGALGTVDQDDDLPYLNFSEDYYIARRHNKGLSANLSTAATAETGTLGAGLELGPVRFDIQTQIVELLKDRMRALATAPQRNAAERSAPYVRIKAFHLHDGSLRYYASAEWYQGTQITDTTSYSIAGWITADPKLQIMALEPRTFGYGADEPELLNVLDLGDGKTGVILSISQGESIETDLFEYRDGVDLKQMRVLQSIAFGE